MQTAHPLPTTIEGLSRRVPAQQTLGEEHAVGPRAVTIFKIRRGQLEGQKGGH
jgi:hypothetical protein